MKIIKVHLRNFRRLENVEIGFESEETFLVGPNAGFKPFFKGSEHLFLTHFRHQTTTQLIDIKRKF